mmetsp:Transcript_83616/g.166943  ORF Transcript_83616/g.166943 Transcript_83616/m.166943 type:complete len:203 (+) Transcript_83616:1114-1722(+)
MTPEKPGRTGRPSGHAGRASIEARWDELEPEARKKALQRHTSDIRKSLADDGIEDWLPSCLAAALSDELFAQMLKMRRFATAMNNHVRELVQMLEAQWGVGLALFLKNELLFSDPTVDKLRLACQKQYVSGKCQRKVWYKCPITEYVEYVPEVIMSRWKWQKAMRDQVSAQGIELYESGKLAQINLREALIGLTEPQSRPLP